MSQTSSDFRGFKRNQSRLTSALYLPTRNISYVPIAKCGSSTFLRALFDSGVEQKKMHVDDLPRDVPAVAMLREPTERAWSAFKQIQHERPTVPHEAPETRTELNKGWYPNVDAKTEWGDFLQALAENYHLHPVMGLFYPQFESLRADVRYTLIPWDFERLRVILSIKEVAHWNKALNPAPMPEVTAAMREALQHLYATDYLLWELIA